MKHPGVGWEGEETKWALHGLVSAGLLMLRHLPHQDPLLAALVAAHHLAELTDQLVLAHLLQTPIHPTAMGAGHLQVIGHQHSGDQGDRAGGVQGAPAVGAGGGHQE